MDQGHDQDQAPEQLFHHSPDHRVVICTACRYAVPPNAVARHLKEIHHIYRSRRRPFTQFVQKLDLADPDHVLAPRDDQFPVPYLPIYDGLQCGVNGCGHLCLTEKRMRSHWVLAKHSVAGHSLQYRCVPVQTFFRGNNLRYFTGRTQRLHGQEQEQERVVAVDCDLETSLRKQQSDPRVRHAVLADVNVSLPRHLHLHLDLSARSLLHHYHTVTCHTIATDAETATLWRDTVVELAHEYNFLMFGILALASLHCAYLNPEQQNAYYVEASRYQDKAMGLFRLAVSSPDKDNCHAVLVFTHLLVLYAFASEKQDDSLLLVTETEGEGDIIPTWLHFLRSGCSMLCTVWEFLESGPCSVLALAWEAPFAGVNKLDETTALNSLLQAALPSSDCTWSEHVRELYREAAAELALACACSQSTPHAFTPWDALRIWPMRVSDGFMSLMKEQHPAALILLAHYSLLLKRIESEWFFRGRATRLMRSIVRKLHPQWHPFIPCA
ncbi:hypothetical protein A1O3_03202 [Capronia epimyces CBS 606.96]|uniref:C2H2-type domain-containing protein n=1 Tax=Capronia epimyces CBS 606.96 TaxID=1182542 RepID=W9YC78_9EURO|nr:uncharacterized protein A1O3_03202 [Capronia epimyces CBS 606.96]EXJ90133.1 hypothetical protein A1O3_03202 [Capronia epimyces CBS 606.96]